MPLQNHSGQHEDTIFAQLHLGFCFSYIWLRSFWTVIQGCALSSIEPGLEREEFVRESPNPCFMATFNWQGRPVRVSRDALPPPCFLKQQHPFLQLGTGPFHPHLWPRNVPDSNCLGVQSDRLGQSGWGRGAWEVAGLLECGLRSLRDMASQVQSSLSNRSLKVHHLGLALVELVEVRW